MARPDKTIYLQPSVRQVSTFTPATIRTALRQLSTGYYDNASMLADAVLADDRVQAALATRVKGMIGLPLNFMPADDSDKAKQIASELQTDFWNMLPEHEAYQMMAYGLLLGACPVQLIWDTSDVPWKVKLEVWHPSLLRRDTFLREWKIKTGDERQERTLENGSDKWFVFTPYGETRGWNSALIRAVAVPWLMKTYAQGDWAQYSEVHGRPIRVGKYPEGANKDDKENFSEDLRTLGSDASIVFTDAFDLTLLEATADTWKSFEGLINWCDKSISIAMLGQNLTTDVSGGSFAAATVHADVKQDIIEGDSKVLSTHLHNHVFKHYVNFNYGNVDLSPWPEWDTVPPPEDGKIYQYHLQYGILTRNEIRARIGFEPLEAGGDEIPQPLMQQGQKDTQQLSAKRVSLASGDNPKNAKGLIAGQSYIDDLTLASVERASQIMAGDVQAVLSFMDSSQTADEFKQKLLDHYKGMNPAELTELNRRAFVLAELAGRYSELQDHA